MEKEEKYFYIFWKLSVAQFIAILSGIEHSRVKVCFRNLFISWLHLENLIYENRNDTERYSIKKTLG